MFDLSNLISLDSFMLLLDEFTIESYSKITLILGIYIKFYTNNGCVKELSFIFIVITWY